jgi:hypothetical protein
MRLERFTLTKELIMLLRKMYVTWQDCESGAPAIDPKRPYGNSDVYNDMHEILTGKNCSEDNKGDQLTQKEVNHYASLHQETETALQIVLFTGKFKAGTYEKEGYGNEWKLVK